MQIGRHFTLAELTRSQTASRHGLDNTPTARALDNLGLLCEHVLDPLREALGHPIYVSSGYRAPEVNRLAGGSPSSQHMAGEAADIDIRQLTAQQLFDWIRASDLPFDQLILEFPPSGWVHVSYSRERQRGQCLIARRVQNGTNYTQTARLPLVHALQHQRDELRNAPEAGIPTEWPTAPPDDWQPIAAPADLPAPPQTTNREISPELLASGLRTLATLLGGALLAMGRINPDQHAKLLGVDWPTIVGAILPVLAYAYSWFEKLKKAGASNAAIAEAIIRSPVRADGQPLTVQNVKAIVKAKEG